MKRLILVLVVLSLVFVYASSALAVDDWVPNDKYLFKIENLEGWKYEEYYQCKDAYCYEYIKRHLEGDKAGTIKLIAGVLPYLKVSLNYDTAKWIICESDANKYFVHMNDEDIWIPKFFQFTFDTNVGDLTLNITKADPLTKNDDATITMPTFYSFDGITWASIDKLKWNWFIGKCDQVFKFTIAFEVGYHQPWGVYESNIEFELSHDLFDPAVDFGEPLYSNFNWDWIAG